MDRAGEARAYISERIAVEDRGYSTPCWVWQKYRTEKGYGRSKVPGFPRQMRVHRAAYELHIGPIPDGLTLDHLCCVKACCNPAHLEPVTALENWSRAFAVSGSSHGGGGSPKRSHCKRGHELAGDNVKTAKDGNRFCVTCCRERKREYMRSWNRANPRGPEHRREYHRQWRQRLKEASR